MGKATRSARMPGDSLPLSVSPNALAARAVIPEKVSALLNFSDAEISAACVSRSPIGAEPGFQSLAIARLHPLSRSFLAGAKFIPRPIDAPGRTVAVVLDFDSAAIPASPDDSRWSALSAFILT